MVFSANPLSLSVPEPAFETWLRDSGYLEIVDQRTSDLHRLSSSSAAVTSSSSSAAAPSTTASSAISNGFFVLFFSNVGTLLSLFTFNPFSKLATSDFSGDTPSWTLKFFGSCQSYSFPSSPAQARLRVHENVKRYARNYASLSILFFACSLYQMPLALVGLLSCIALWDLFNLYGGRFGLDQYPTTKLILIRIAQCVMILHASFRKLTPSKQSTQVIIK
ncbi:PREDICTED: PRA1 family protein H isoform X2 [Ipomoea nil]|uniref:PRA1 family protein H isoform X2 n=1 Tax=Ipomoea nil TaxID=35883 RepID=UPI000900C1AA|nr:PREDICTED: PRA1 family protein H isoform X2 [Ipomoea nil]